MGETILEKASIRCAHAHAPAAKPFKSLTELTHSGLFRPSKDLYYVSLLEGELGTTFSKSTLTEEPDSLRELQNSELGSWDTGENSGKLQVSVGNSRYEKSRGQFTCGIGKDPAILPKRCGLWVGRHLSDRMCGASLTVGLCTRMCTLLGTCPQSHTYVNSHTSRCRPAYLQEHTHILWKPLLESSHPRKQEPHTCSTSTQTRAPYTLTLNTARKRSTKQHKWTHTAIVWSPSKHRQVQCVQPQLVHTGAPSRRWNKGTCVDTQITRLHPHRVTKATEMGPWGGSGILVSRGAERPRNTWTTFQRLLSVEYFYPWHSNVTQPPGSSSVAITKADRVAGFESRLGGVPAWPVQGPGSHLIEYQTTSAEKQLTGHGERS